MNYKEVIDAISKSEDKIMGEISEMRKEHKQFQREFYLFKGKFTAITGLIVTCLAIFGDTIKKKLGL